VVTELQTAQTTGKLSLLDWIFSLLDILAYCGILVSSCVNEFPTFFFHAVQGHGGMAIFSA
jgi:hypothetical protein